MQFGEGIQEIEDMDLEEGKNVVPLDVNEVLENKDIYPAMTAFTDQYSLPNNFFDIGQL